MFKTQDSERARLDRQDRAGLSGADRAWMMAVAERELAQGKISVEEYRYIANRCRVSIGDTVSGLVARFRRATRFIRDRGSSSRSRMTPRHA